VASRQYEVDVTGAPKTFTYDANGNMTSDGTRVYSWNARNELVRSVSATQDISYSWGGAKQLARVAETQLPGGSSVEREFIWCGLELCVSRVGTAETLLFPGGELTASSSMIYALDHLGTPRRSTNAAGAATSTSDVDPFGRAEGTSHQSTVSFDGMRSLASDALHHTAFRSYSPAIGRWLSEDPASLVDGANMSLFVRNNPLRYVDPLGLATCTPQGITPLTPWLPKRNIRRPLTNWAFADTVDLGSPPNVAGIVGTILGCRWERIVEVTAVEFQVQLISRLCVEPPSNCKPSRYWWEYDFITAERTRSYIHKEQTLTAVVIPSFLDVDGVKQLICMQRGQPHP
jgi:RHS repeat-associated protein